jgi:hypothetical protein
VRKLAAVALAVTGFILWLHRSVVHQVVVDSAAGVAALAGLCVAAYAARQLAGRRAARQPARYRAVPPPAVAERPKAGRPGTPCAECAGRPATRVFERWPVCDGCGSRLDASAGRLGGFAVPVPEPAGGSLPALTQPPVLPAGETIGTIDMTEFEESA